jgi:hypothetical protein
MTFYALMFGMGLCWLIAYLLIIRQGFRDRTFGMPIGALCANLSWEVIFSFIIPHHLPQRAIDITWMVFDCVILYQVLRWGPREFPHLTRIGFYASVVAGLVTSVSSVLFVTYEFANYNGAYTAFGINLLMSILFIAMLFRRGSTRGQSVWIAVSKMLGTVCASLLFWIYVRATRGSVLLPFLYVSSFVFDLMYVLQLAWWDRLSPVFVTTTRSD